MTLTPPKTKLSISNPVYGKGRRYAGERQRDDECGELDGCLQAPCDRGSGCLCNSRCNRRGYDDLFRVTADVAGLLPHLQPATGPHPVPAPLAGELCRARGHTFIGLRAQPSDRLPVIERAGRNGFGNLEMVLLEFGRPDRMDEGLAPVLQGHSSQPSKEAAFPMIVAVGS